MVCCTSVLPCRVRRRFLDLRWIACESSVESQVFRLARHGNLTLRGSERHHRHAAFRGRRLWRHNSAASSRASVMMSARAARAIIGAICAKRCLCYLETGVRLINLAEQHTIKKTTLQRFMRNMSDQQSVRPAPKTRQRFRYAFEHNDRSNADTRGQAGETTRRPI